MSKVGYNFKDPIDFHVFFVVERALPVRGKTWWKWLAYCAAISVDQECRKT